MDELRVSRRQILAGGAVAPFLAALPGRAEAATSSNPADLSLIEVLPLLERRELSARELVDACIARVEAFDPQVLAFRLPTFDLARAGAARADGDRAAGRLVGPLAGVPVGLKDTYYTSGIPTTARSKVLADFVPDSDATVWARLSAAGAVLLGKLNCTEFAYGTGSPPTRNPWDLERQPGGSSGGSGAALAARMLPAALGGDTGASIRVPAAVCGVSGVKPTYGRCSRHGGVPLAWSLDTAGPMTRRMADAAVLLQLMAGPDPADATSLDAPVPTYPSAPPPTLTGVRIGIPDRFFWDGVDAGIARVCRDALRRLEAMGAELVDFPAPPSTDEVLGRAAANPYGAFTAYETGLATAYETTVLVEATSYHRRPAEERGHLYSPEVLAAIEAGETIHPPCMGAFSALLPGSESWWSDR